MSWDQQPAGENPAISLQHWVGSKDWGEMSSLVRAAGDERLLKGPRIPRSCKMRATLGFLSIFRGKGRSRSQQAVLSVWGSLGTSTGGQAWHLSPVFKGQLKCLGMQRNLQLHCKLIFQRKEIITMNSSLSH